MSTRTIIEINHDYLRELTPEVIAELQMVLAGGGLNTDWTLYLSRTQGIRFLGQRHHSNSMTLTIDGYEAHKE